MCFNTEAVCFQRHSLTPEALAYRDSRAFHGVATRGMGGTNVSRHVFFFFSSLFHLFALRKREKDCKSLLRDQLDLLVLC